MPHDLVHRLGALLQLPPDENIVDTLKDILQEKFGHTPSRDVLHDHLFQGRPMSWLLTYHIGLLIRKYPDWLITSMDHNPDRRVQVRTFLDGLAKKAVADTKHDPKPWLMSELRVRGLEASPVTINRWLTGQGALQSRFRLAVADILDVNPEALPPASHGRSTTAAPDRSAGEKCLYEMIWAEGADRRDEPQVRPWIEIAGEPDKPGFIFRIQSAMDRHPGRVPSAAEMQAVLTDPSMMTWPVTLKCVQVFDEVLPFALPPGANPGERHKRIIMALARHGRPGSDQELTKWLLEALPTGRSRTVMASLHAWMSGTSNAHHDSVSRIEQALHLPLGTIWSGHPEQPAVAPIKKVPSGFKSARNLLGPLGFGDLGTRCAMILQIDGPTSLSRMAEILSDILMEKTGIDFPEALTLTWLTGQVRPSPLETEILGASLAVAPRWLEAGARVTSRKDRSIELREMSSKLTTQMRSWRSIMTEHGDDGFSDAFRTRLCVALAIRGALKEVEATDEDIYAAARYLMHLRFELIFDENGDIKKPPHTHIDDLATRCGVETAWLSDGKASEHSFIRHMLGQRQILI